MHHFHLQKDNRKQFEIKVLYYKMYNSFKLNNYFNYTPIEEIVIPTLSISTKNFFNLKQGKNVLNFPIDTNDFTMLPHQFTVKSVPRDINHPLRVKVRGVTETV